MSEQFLYQELDAFSRFGGLSKDLPDSVKLNLNPAFELREYQIEAFARLLHCYKNDFPDKAYPLHFLFNMATGSGKTLIMAGLILYFFEKGYRNFLFFVSSTNIIEKTKDNFLNPSSIKYLFNQSIYVANQRTQIKAVDNFEAANPNDINVCFTTIQKLHSDMTTEKENALTFEDFRTHKVVLIADEAHHMNVKTKGQTEMFDNWENTVERIFAQNENNLLLEFTATHDYETSAMIEKYRNKVIIRYDLIQFRNDRFSKDVILVHSDFDLNARILQALILSQYKQEVAARNRINLKPVLLFKAQRTIEQSRENKANFHKIIEGLTAKDVENIRRKSDLPQIRRAFAFFDSEGISSSQLTVRLKSEFQEDYCLSVNDENEKERYQLLVNTLEHPENRIRAIFTVRKLNEGWDVLNLFDIVRCYESRDTGRRKIGTTTVSEAQLIGRGARYFPFSLPSNNDRFRRKLDGDLSHELRIIEELHYHSINDSRYITEIRAALIEQGMMDDREVTRELKLKEPFKKTELYKFGLVWLNDRRPKDYRSVESFADLGLKKRNHIHVIATGHGGATVALERKKKAKVLSDETRVDLKVKAIARNIVQATIARNPFFTFASLKRYFPNLDSMQSFMDSDEYLGGWEITFQGNVGDLDQNRAEKLGGMLGLLGQLEVEIRKHITEFEGTSNFRADRVRDIFEDKLLKFDASNPRAAEDTQFEAFVSSKDWFAFNMVYGTSEEKAFVRMLERQMQMLQEQYEQIYLLRNEGHFAIYNFGDGKAFQPDFVLFLREKNGEFLMYQVFIEPKGKHLQEHDRWKETFLKEISSMFEGDPLRFEDKKYRLIGVPFYNNEDENKFMEGLESILQ